MTSDSADRFATRLATDDDLEQVVDVCSTALGWNTPNFDTELFSWKHRSNAFGPSLILVATDTEADDKIVAVRTFMRWRFATRDGATVAAARAVDTATLPEAQGRGLFTKLTLAGLEILEEEGCGFVFNTPNSKSLPGYLKMGWFAGSNIAFGIGVRSIRALPRVARSRIAAEKPSLELPTLGVPADVALAELSKVTTGNPQAVLRTDHTRETLLWRYAGGPITYRFLPIGDDSGLVVRLRRRGQIKELLISEVIGTPAPSAVSTEVQVAMSQSDADVAVAPAGTPKTIAVPVIGPELALRTLNQPVTPTQFDWNPGDVELF